MKKSLTTGQTSKIAWVYARKSTRQDGDGNDRSTHRQIADADAWADAEAGRSTTAHIYVDEAVCGADLKRLTADNACSIACAAAHRPT